jgi:hypothetical protein
MEAKQPQEYKDLLKIVAEMKHEIDDLKQEVKTLKGLR